MKFLKLRNVLLAIALVFFMQNAPVLLPDLPESAYSDEELISPQNNSPDHDTHLT